VQGYFEIDVDIHTWSSATLSAFHTLVEKIPLMLLRGGVVIEADGDAEMPEQLLAFIVASPELQQAAPLLFAASLQEVVLPHCAPPRTAGRALRLSDALAMLSERQLVQALPIVDETGALIDVLSSRDVRHLASHSHTDDLTTPIELSLRSLPPSPVRLHTCRPTDTVGSAISRLANADVGQLVCVDSSGAVCGVISSSDLLSSLLEPHLPTRVEG
jgi:CBS domain-containing protein